MPNHINKQKKPNSNGVISTNLFDLILDSSLRIGELLLLLLPLHPKAAWVPLIRGFPLLLLPLLLHLKPLLRLPLGFLRRFDLVRLELGFSLRENKIHSPIAQMPETPRIFPWIMRPQLLTRWKNPRKVGT